MSSRTLVLPDGSFLVVTLDLGEQLGEEKGTPAEEPAGGTLDAGQAAADVAVFVGEAVGAGVTFEVLKAAAKSLYRRVGIQPEADALSAADIRDVAVEFLSESGYADIQVAEVKHISGEGWTVTGTADGARFRALSDESGALVHVRVR